MTVQPLLEWDPKQLGKYTLTGRLGAGGFGTVYAAKDPHGTPVAVKMLRPELAADQGLRNRLAREGEAMRRVNSERTVDIIDVVTDGPVAYLVMELVDGTGLDEHIANNGPLHGPILWFTAEGLVDALAAIHHAGIVHRDFKPSNVMLSPDGAKVLDFGVSVIAEETSHTATGAFLGSAAWISPEQVNGDDATPASDIFTLGLVLAYAATGQHPYGTGRADAVMFRIAHQQPDLTGIPHPLTDAVTACLATNPNDRPTIDALTNFFRSGGNDPLNTGNTSGPHGTLIVGATPAFIAATSEPDTTPHPTPEPEPEPEPDNVNHSPDADPDTDNTEPDTNGDDADTGNTADNNPAATSDTPPPTTTPDDTAATDPTDNAEPAEPSHTDDQGPPPDQPVTPPPSDEPGNTYIIGNTPPPAPTRTTSKSKAPIAAVITVVVALTIGGTMFAALGGDKPDNPTANSTQDDSASSNNAASRQTNQENIGDTGNGNSNSTPTTPLDDSDGSPLDAIADDDDQENNSAPASLSPQSTDPQPTTTTPRPTTTTAATAPITATTTPTSSNTTIPTSPATTTAPRPTTTTAATAPITATTTPTSSNTTIPTSPATTTAPRPTTSTTTTLPPVIGGDGSGPSASGVSIPSTVAAGNTLTISANWTDPSGIRNAYVSLYSTDAGVSANCQPGSEDAWYPPNETLVTSTTVTLTCIINPNQAGAVYEVGFYASDLLGNSGSAGTYSTTITNSSGGDGSGPSASGVSIPSTVAAGNTLTISANWTDPSGIRNAYVSLYSTDAGVSANCQPGSEDAWYPPNETPVTSTTVTLTCIINPNQAGAVYEVGFYASDLLGNSGSAGTYSTTITNSSGGDGSGPSASGVSIPSTVAAGNTLTISANWTDPSGIRNAYVSLYSTDAGVSANCQPGSEDAWYPPNETPVTSTTVTLTCIINPNQAGAVYEVGFYASDLLGNSGSAGTYSTTITNR